MLLVIACFVFLAMGALIFALGAVILGAALVAASALVGWRLLQRKFAPDGNIVAGAVLVAGESLPEFRVDVCEVGKTAALLSRRCTNGVFVLHDLPRAELELTWVWGEGDCCSQSCQLKVRHALQFVDLDVPLEVKSLVTPGSPPTMTLRFPSLKVTGEAVRLASKLRYHCTLTVKPDVKSGNPAAPTEHTYKQQVFDCSEKPCEAQYTQATLSDDPYQYKYTITAWVDGASHIQRKTAAGT